MASAHLGSPSRSVVRSSSGIRSLAAKASSILRGNIGKWRCRPHPCGAFWSIPSFTRLSHVLSLKKLKTCSASLLRQVDAKRSCSPDSIRPRNCMNCGKGDCLGRVCLAGGHGARRSGGILTIGSLGAGNIGGGLRGWSQERFVNLKYKCSTV